MIALRITMRIRSPSTTCISSIFPIFCINSHASLCMRIFPCYPHSVHHTWWMHIQSVFLQHQNHSSWYFQYLPLSFTLSLSFLLYKLCVVLYTIGSSLYNVQLLGAGLVIVSSSVAVTNHSIWQCDISCAMTTLAILFKLYDWKYPILQMWSA